jgi:hypothetical protein
VAEASQNIASELDFSNLTGPKEQELNSFEAFLYGRTAVRPFKRQNIRSDLIREPKEHGFNKWRFLWRGLAMPNPYHPEIVQVI